MPRVGLVVEPQFLNVHHGVRNYVLALAAALRLRGHAVDFLIPSRSLDMSFQWYDVTPLPTLLEQSPLLSGSPSQSRRHYSGRDRRAAEPAPAALHCIGSEIPEARYAAIVVTAAWIDLPARRLPAPRVAGLVYDVNPNTYALTRTADAMDFAGVHRRGFRYYREACDLVLAISERTQAEFLTYFAAREAVVLPPFPPASYHALGPSARDAPRERAVVLAAPFDHRKGMAEIPGLLGALGPALERLYLYGGTDRCTRQERRDFLAALPARDVTWLPQATDAEVQDLYARSRVLLFPSHDEGLGLPILEAQMLGCRVVVRDRMPMRALARSGAVLLPARPAPDEADRFRDALRSCLDDGFDHAALAAEARAAFDAGRAGEALAQALAL